MIQIKITRDLGNVVVSAQLLPIDSQVTPQIIDA